MWLQAGKSDLTASYEHIEISVPTSYITFAVAMALSNSLIKLINYFILNEFIRIASNRLFKFDNSAALALMIDSENAWNLPLWRQYRFLGSGSRHLLLVNVAGLILMAPLMMLFSFALWTYYCSMYRILVLNGILSFSALLCISGAIMIAFPIIYTILLRAPISFHKNQTFIRWNFLYKIYKRNGLAPDHVRRWLQQALPPQSYLCHGGQPLKTKPLELAVGARNISACLNFAGKLMAHSYSVKEIAVAANAAE